MIDLEKLDLEYNDYKNIRVLYIKNKSEFEKFNKKNSEKLKGLLVTYNSIKNIRRNSSRHDTMPDELLEDFIEKNPLFGEWYDLDCKVKNYKNKLQQYSSTTNAFMECSRFICLKHKDDDGYDLFDLYTQDKLDLSQYDNDKQQYIINDLKNHHSFICYATQEDLPLLMQVVKEVDNEIAYNDSDTEDEMEQKIWEEITRCYIIEKEFEKRKNLISLKEINNIEHEKKLVELLGYNLIGPDKSNRWLITDENNNQVGFIQYKKLFKKNNKKGFPATYGYHIEINSNEISYNSTRKVDKENDKIGIDTRFNYELDIKRENGDIDHLEINLGENPGLTLWSKEYGFMNFRLDWNGLFLNFKSKTENFNVEETIVYQIVDRQISRRPNEYAYQLNYCDKDIDLDYDLAKGIRGRSITGKSDPYQQDHSEINVIERSWINNKLRTNKENIVAGTIEEMARKQKMGIDAFKHFRFLINQILPFKQEVISLMLDYYKNEELALFIPELGAVSEEMIQQRNYDYKESNWIQEMQKVASMLTREKSMELIDARKEFIEEKMKEIEKREEESEILGMLEDEDYDEEEWNMLLGTSRQSNSLKKNNVQEKTLVRKKKDSKTTE